MCVRKNFPLGAEVRPERWCSILINRSDDVAVKVRKALAALTKADKVTREFIVIGLHDDELAIERGQEPFFTCAERTRDGVRRLVSVANVIVEAMGLRNKLAEVLDPAPLDHLADHLTDQLVDQQLMAIADVENLDQAGDFVIEWIREYEGTDAPAKDSEPR